MARSPADPLLNKDRMQLVADEQAVGGHFEGESERERSVGIDHVVVVDIFKRVVGLDAGTYFLRVSLRDPNDSRFITRHEIDLDKYSNEADFLKEVEWGGGALAEKQCTRGAQWDCEFIAKQAREAAKELLKEYHNQ